ncbi:hypothetical protein DL98DRAFT_598415 [Cadophora sp. DSE1049]|nr:hypothetical protein DL98DRAFT_598415 [Cadophora sp. DSE1049]
MSKEPLSWEEFTVVPGKVLTSFTSTAYLTLIVCVFYYCFHGEERTNPVDQIFIDGLYRDIACHIISISPQTRYKWKETWKKALLATMLAFSDQQAITGIAILTSGFSQLASGLSSYHWINIVNLAWFSSLTHLTILTMLRAHLQQHRALRTWRLISMAVMAIMLSCGLWSTGYFLRIDPVVADGLGVRSTPFEFPAWCLFHPGQPWADSSTGSPLSHIYNTAYVVCPLTLLTVTYLSRVALVFLKNTAWLEENLRKRPREKVDEWPLLQQHRRRLFYSPSIESLMIIRTIYSKLVFSIFVVLLATFDLYSSMLWEITWLAFALAWGSVRIFHSRTLVQVRGSEALVEENVWGFGQVLAVMILALPLVSLYETILGMNFQTP